MRDADKDYYDEEEYGPRPKAPSPITPQLIQWIIRRELDHRRPEKRDRMMSFSKWIVAATMLLFFVNAGLGVYMVLNRGEPLQTLYDYTFWQTMVVLLGYFVKAFGENIAREVLSYLSGKMAVVKDTNKPFDTAG